MKVRETIGILPWLWVWYGKQYFSVINKSNFTESKYKWGSACFHRVLIAVNKYWNKAKCHVLSRVWQNVIIAKNCKKKRNKEM